MICIDCVTPVPLKKLVSEQGTNQTCQYCGSDAISITPTKLFDYILERIDENTATEDDLSGYEHGMLFECGADIIPIASLDEVLAEWAELGDEPYFDDLWKYAATEFRVNARGMGNPPIFSSGQK